MHDALHSVMDHAVRATEARADEVPPVQLSAPEIEQLFQEAQHKTGKLCRQLFEEAFAEERRKIEAAMREKLRRTFHDYLHDMRKCPPEVIEHVRREIAGTNLAQADSWFP